MTYTAIFIFASHDRMSRERERERERAKVRVEGNDRIIFVSSSNPPTLDLEPHHPIVSSRIRMINLLPMPLCIYIIWVSVCVSDDIVRCRILAHKQQQPKKERMQQECNKLTENHRARTGYWFKWRPSFPIQQPTRLTSWRVIVNKSGIHKNKKII